jgi:hypothetical protein
MCVYNVDDRRVYFWKYTWRKELLYFEFSAHGFPLRSLGIMRGFEIIIIQFNSIIYYLRAELTAKRPITDTAGNYIIYKPKLQVSTGGK